MRDYTIHFATNRNPEGTNDAPTRYGKDFSVNGREDLRFGKVTLRADENEVTKVLDEEVESMGKGNGQRLSSYFEECDPAPRIEVFNEHLEKEVYGSKQFFGELKSIMMDATDVLVFIHGYNVTWDDAVGSAIALQEMLNRPTSGDQTQKVAVVLFSWPSDGSMFPYRAYFSDRGAARDSGYAVGRGFLKLRDFLLELRIKIEKEKQEERKEGSTVLCDQDIHLLCHSMGNFVLQHALNRIDEHAGQTNLPRLFRHIFLCSADVDDDALEAGQPMERLEEMCFNISIYYNNEDKALFVSETTKGNPDRLGTHGAARPYRLHNKIH